METDLIEFVLSIDGRINYSFPACFQFVLIWFNVLNQFNANKARLKAARIEIHLINIIYCFRLHFIRQSFISWMFNSFGEFSHSALSANSLIAVIDSFRQFILSLFLKLASNLKPICCQN